MNFLPPSIFGTYTPLLGPDGAVIPGLAGVDFGYILNVLVFLVLLSFILRLIAGWFRR